MASNDGTADVVYLLKILDEASMNRCMSFLNRSEGFAGWRVCLSSKAFQTFLELAAVTMMTMNCCFQSTIPMTATKCYEFRISDDLQLMVVLFPSFLNTSFLRCQLCCLLDLCDHFLAVPSCFFVVFLQQFSSFQVLAAVAVPSPEHPKAFRFLPLKILPLPFPFFQSFHSCA